MASTSDVPAQLGPKATAWLSQELGQAKAAAHGLAQVAAFGEDIPNLTHPLKHKAQHTCEKHDTLTGSAT